MNAGLHDYIDHAQVSLSTSQFVSFVTVQHLLYSLTSPSLLVVCSGSASVADHYQPYQGYCPGS
jgi:hypothetical protein